MTGASPSKIFFPPRSLLVFSFSFFQSPCGRGSAPKTPEAEKKFVEKSNETPTPLENIYRTGFGNPMDVGTADDRGPHRSPGSERGRCDALIWVGLGGCGHRSPTVNSIAGILLAVDRPLDIFRRLVNIFSDSVGTVIIAQTEVEILNSKNSEFKKI